MSVGNSRTRPSVGSDAGKDWWGAESGGRKRWEMEEATLQFGKMKKFWRSVYSSANVPHANDCTF